MKLYYLDHLHAAAAPQNKLGTPRIKFFDNNIIKALTKADKRKVRHGAEPFGHCEVSYSYLTKCIYDKFYVKYMCFVSSTIVCITNSWSISTFTLILYFSFEARPRHAIQLYLSSIANPRQVYAILYTYIFKIYGTNGIGMWSWILIIFVEQPAEVQDQHF
jgi:hypothetical protein